MFTTHVYATDPESGERIEVAAQPFEQLAKAELYAQCEAHGLQDASWEVRALLTVEQAVNVVKASRNRTINVHLAVPGCDSGQYLQLKAPLTVDALERVYAGRIVPVLINKSDLFCG